MRTIYVVHVADIHDEALNGLEEKIWDSIKDETVISHSHNVAYNPTDREVDKKWIASALIIVE